MPFEEVSLKRIIPNPYRDIQKYPLNPEKVNRLMDSVRRTGFWDNVVTRKVAPNFYELAYGHHRIEAARRVLGADAKVNVIVRDIPDDMMLKMMAAENDDWQTAMPIKQRLEVISATIALLGEKTPANWRARENKREGQISHKVADFLGWGVSITQRYLALYRGIQGGNISAKVLDELPTDIGAVLSIMRCSKKYAKQSRDFTPEQQVSIAQKAKKDEKNSAQRIVRILAADLAYPLKSRRADVFETTLKDAAKQAYRLDVAMKELRHLTRQTPTNYSRLEKSIEAAHLAASIQSVVNITKGIFTRKQLQSVHVRQLKQGR